MIAKHTEVLEVIRIHRQSKEQARTHSRSEAVLVRAHAGLGPYLDQSQCPRNLELLAQLADADAHLTGKFRDGRQSLTGLARILCQVSQELGGQLVSH